MESMMDDDDVPFDEAEESNNVVVVEHGGIANLTDVGASASVSWIAAAGGGDSTSNDEELPAEEEPRDDHSLPQPAAQDDEATRTTIPWTRKRTLVVGMIVVMAAAVLAIILGVVLSGNDDNGGGEESARDTNAVGAAETFPMTPTVAPTSRPSLRPTTTTSPSSSTINFTNSSSVVLMQTLYGMFHRDTFGYFIAFSRDNSTLAVGAAKGNYVQVFRWNGTQYTQLGQTILGDRPGEQFGRCVDLNRDGSMVVVGAWNNHNGPHEKAGVAKVFSLVNNVWHQVGQGLRGYAAEDRNGWYVQLSDDGSIVAVTGRRGDPNNIEDAGYVRVFAYDGNFTSNEWGDDEGGDRWFQLGTDLQGDSFNDQFGRTLGLSSDGRRLATAYPRNSYGKKGRAQVFDYSAGLWNQVGQDVDGENVEDSLSTCTMSADGLTLAAGSSSANNTDFIDSGLVRVFELVDGNWTQKGQTLYGEGSGDDYGGNHLSLSDDGNCLAVGANNNNEKRGKAHFFRWNGTGWDELITVSGNRDGDRVGFSVSVTGDCSLVAFAVRRDELATGPEPGAVLIYRVLPPDDG